MVLQCQDAEPFFFSDSMSNSSADWVTNLELAMFKHGAPVGTATETVRCVVPLHYAWITPENCRSLAPVRTEKKVVTPPVTTVDVREVVSAMGMANALRVTIRGPEYLEAKKKKTDTTSSNLLEFSESDEEEGKDEPPERTPTPAKPKRDRLEIAAAAGDMLLEALPADFDDMPIELQKEFHELRTISVVAKSQEARISTIEDETQKKREKWKNVTTETPRNARFTYDIDWDVFMPNLLTLQKGRMLMVGTVGFSTMFEPALEEHRKFLSHTERIFEDISKNTNIPKDHIFLKIPFPGAKKKDGCRAIPFGFLPLVFHYLRPASLRKCVNVERTRALLLKCYAETARYFKRDMPAIVKRQLRQFACNMSKSIIGDIGDPLDLLKIRRGDVQACMLAIDAEPPTSLEVTKDDESSPQPQSQPPDEMEIDEGTPPTTQSNQKSLRGKWPEMKDTCFSDSVNDGPDSMDSIPAISNVAIEDEYGYSIDLDQEDDGEEEEEDDSDDEMEEEEEEEVGVRERLRPTRPTTSLKDQLLEMRYNHHTDDELDALISHHLDVLAEMNEVRRMRRVASRCLRERMQQRQVPRESTRHTSNLRKRKRTVTVSEEKQLEDACPPPKRSAVSCEYEDKPSKDNEPSPSVEDATNERPKKKLRVYRMQSKQILTSLPEVIRWTTASLQHVMTLRPQTQNGQSASQIESRNEQSGEVSQDDEYEGEDYGDDGDSMEGHESEDLGSVDSDDEDSEENDVDEDSSV